MTTRIVRIIESIIRIVAHEDAVSRMGQLRVVATISVGESKDVLVVETAHATTRDVEDNGRVVVVLAFDLGPPALFHDRVSPGREQLSRNPAVPRSVQRVDVLQVARPNTFPS